MNDRKRIFFTSDWHIGHKKVLEYSNRPFSDVEAMNKHLVRNFNATVPPGSITYFLGDVGFASSEEVKKVLSQLNPGTKILILGNHDKNATAMHKLGFDVVLNSATIYIAKERVTLSHCPLLGVWREDTTNMKSALPGSNWHGDHKNFAYTVKDEGQFHLHGHIHSPNKGQSQKILNKQFDVGVDGNGFRPVSISQIESWIAKYKAGEKK